MPPKKGPSTDAPEALTAQWIRGASSSQLLSRLIATSKALETVDMCGSFDKAVFAPSLVEEITKKEFTNHPTADVQVITSCIIADVMRVLAPQLPFETRRCVDIFTLFCSTVNKLRTSKGAYQQYVRHLLERSSTVHSFAVLIHNMPAAQMDEDGVDGQVASLFETILCHVQTDDDAMISQLAQTAADCIAATNSITETQMTILLSAVTAQRGTTGYKIAVLVIKRQEDVLQSAFHSHVMRLYEDAAEALHKFDVVDGDTAEKKAILKDVAHACNIFVELCSISSNAVTTLVPSLKQQLTNDSFDLRSITVRAFARAFVHPQMQHEYGSAYHAFLGRFSDPKPVIRQELLKFATNLLMHNPDSDAAWAHCTQFLRNKLIDSEDSIRKTAISCVAELAMHVPNRVPQTLVAELVQRCLDKKLVVRQLAVQLCAELYACVVSKFPDAYAKVMLVPNAVFNSIAVDGNTALVELALPVMLPVPSDKQQQQQSKRAGRGGASSNTGPLIGGAPVFDFELDDITGSGGSDAAAGSGGASSSGSSSVYAIDGTFASALVNFCGCLDNQGFKFFTTLMAKKAQMRLTVGRLYDLRNAIRKEGAESVEGQQTVHQIHRLLAFLVNVTHAKNDEWDALFKTKDEKVVKAISAMCTAACKDFYSTSNDVVSKVKVSFKKDVSSFVQTNLVHRLAMPLNEQHVKEIVSVVDQCKILKLTETNKQRLASVRALLTVGTMAPQLLAPHSSKILSWIKDAIDNSNDTTHDQRLFEAYMHALFSLLNAVGTAVESGTPQGLASAKPLQDQSKQIITLIGRVCLQSTSPGIAKSACRCLVQLYGVHQKAFQQLLGNIKEKLAKAASQETAKNYSPAMPSWLKTFQMIAQMLPEEASLLGDAMFESVSKIIMAATRCNDADPSAKKASVLTFTTPSCLVVDCAAKALLNYASSLSGAFRPAKLAEAYDTLLDAFRATRDVGPKTPLAAKKRLVIQKQLLKAFCHTSASGAGGSLADINRHLLTAIFTSAEDNIEVRQASQRKTIAHIMAGRGDMHFAACLFASAIAEEHRASFNALKQHIQGMTDKLREKQISLNISLSDQRALRFYPEYAIPTLVLLMAHHSYFDDELENNQFYSFQRVWHLLFEELFRHDTQCVSFVSEMLRKIKQHDDSLAPQKSNTRVICDLAMKVMYEILSQKTTTADTTKQFPGAILLPRFFLRPEDADVFPPDQVYLDAGVTIAHQAPFRSAAFGVTPARGGKASRSMDPAGSRASSVDGGLDYYGEEGATTRNKSARTEHSPSASSSSHRATLGKTPANTFGTAAGAGGGTTNVKKSGSKAQPSVTRKTPITQAALRKRIEGVVEDLTRGMEYEEMSKITWRTVKQQVENELAMQVDETLKDIVHDCLLQVLSAAKEEA